MKSVWRAIAVWYRSQGRDLPWRDISDAYSITVSEFMLQQTQVDRVVPIFRRFIALFPDWKTLANAPQSAVVRAWSGLGYNLRAVRLKRLAQEVMTVHGGMLPSDTELLLTLKGIGPYTARALRVFAFRQRALAPDTNLRRVLYRLFKGLEADPKVFDERSWLSWEGALPERLSYEVNQGLMDIGSSICKARKTLCESCPLASFCASYPEIPNTTLLPKQKKAHAEKKDDRGVPNRMYRGRVVEELRKRSISSREFDDLGRIVRAGFDPTHRSWLLGVLTNLEKDGLVKKVRGRWLLT